MFENQVVRKIFVPKGDAVRDYVGVLHNEELCDLCR